MRKRFINLLFICIVSCLPAFVYADGPIDDGIYSIACTKQNGYLGLGAYHSVDAYIYYVTDGQEMTDDAYWVITNTESGYTFRNEATNELLVFTYGREDQYYKYMTLASEPLGDQSEFWNIIEGADGAYSIQSVVDTDYYWNLRAGSNMMGTYKGSNGTSANERMVFQKKADTPIPDPDPDPAEAYTFPEALHVYLSDGRIEAYPLTFVTDHIEQEGQLVIQTNIGQTFSYDLTAVDSVSEQRPQFPTFDVFRFNKKSNDQLFGSVIGEMVGDTVFAEIAAIGKRLTPTYTLTDEQDAEVYVNGELQTSKETRLRYDEDIYYLITRKGCSILTAEEDNKYFMHPYGRYVRVHVDWLTDRAEVPAIYINTSDGQPITSKDYYKDAVIIIDGHGIFPSMDTTAVQIKGRGNSSWGWTKKPYRLKFEEKQKPLGMTKGKSWVLLANGIGGSLMSNAVGMKAANLMGASAANHIVPVDLYLNGEYRGSYNFTEKVGFSNNSVDLTDETYAALLELDSYYDEPVGQKFRSTPYDLPINVKEPVFSEGLTGLTLDDISTSFNRFMTALYRGQDISKYVDLEQLARFMMVNELTLNYEFYHPKSTFCYRENFMEDTCKYIFGPVWDLDWGFGYEQNRNYFTSGATSNYWTDMPSMEAVSFIQDLRFKYEPLSTVYQELWEQFMENDLQELLEYVQDYYDFAHNSFDLNATKWGDRTNYAQQVQQAVAWLQTRSDQIYADILSGKKPYIPDPAEPIEFANDKLYTITSQRGALVLTADHKGLTVEQERYYSYTAEEARFAIIGIEGQNYLYSPLTKQYLAYSNNGTWVSMLGTPIVFDDAKPNGQYLYMLSCTSDAGQTLYFNHNNQKLVINSYYTPDAGNRWLIEEVADFDPTEALELASQSLLAVTNRYIWQGEVIGEEVRQLPKGAMPPEPSSQWANAFVKLTEPDDMPFQIDDDTTIDYQVQWYGPFSFSTSMEDAYWYNMTIRTYYHVGKQSTEPYYPSVVDEETLLYDPNYFWAFGGNPYHVKVYNYTTGFDETLTAVGDYAAMQIGDYAWDLLPNKDGFVLRMPGSTNGCLNQFGGTEGPLKFWFDDKSATDEGSTFRINEAHADAIAKVKTGDARATKILKGGRIYILRDGKTYTTAGTEAPAYSK
ncbi:MAG: CotH kinase family protein [Bacteroidaceae bacterium]|nr:CotH kinase family protein [Bacteroidaceae bacterium]